MSFNDVPTRPRAQGYGAALGDSWYRTAASPEIPLRLYNRDSLAERQDDRGSPEENVLDLGYAFSRSNLTGGEGLDYYPRQHGEEGTDRDRIRFWDSADVLIERPDAGHPYALTLVPDVELFWSPTADAVDIAACLGRIYIAEGENVHRFDDLSDTTPNDTDDLGVQIVALDASLDRAVAVVDVAGDIWYKGAQTDTYLRVYDASVDDPQLPALAVWLVKGRILAYCNDSTTASNGILLEIAPIIEGTPASPTSGAHVRTIVDTFQGAVYDVVDAGHAIVAAFHDGSLRSYVPQTDEAGGVPQLTIRARANLPTGEAAYQLAWNLGTLLVFTIDTNRDHVRVYSAVVLDERFDFVVGQLQLLRTWEGAVQAVPAYTANPVSTRDAIYFWIGEAADDYNLWRYDLVTTGLFRERADNASTAPTGGVIMDDTLVWIRAGDIYREAQTLKTFGYVITPNITFGLNTPINWTSFVAEAQNLEVSGCEVRMYYSTDAEAILDPSHPGWVLVTTFSDPALSGVEQTKINVTANTLALKIELNTDADSTVSPEVVRFAVRGLPKHRDWIAEIPISISDEVTAPGRAPIRVPGLGDMIHERLLNTEGASTTLTVLEPPVVLRGIVDKIIEPVTSISHRGSQGRVAVIMFRGTRVGTGGVSTGTTGLGIGLLGVATLGVDT